MKKMLQNKMKDIESFPRLVAASKKTFQEIFGHEASNQEVSERKTNKKANEWKTE